MSRDHGKLDVFHDAHRLALAIYRSTSDFPRDEWYGMRLQIRRSAVSVPANLVEGNARRTTAEYCSFLNIALGSACELAYLISLAVELGLFGDHQPHDLVSHSQRVVRRLQTLCERMNSMLETERSSRARHRPEGGDRT